MVRLMESINQTLAVKSVSAPKEIMSKQKLPYFLGISDRSAGAKAISMTMVVIPPGGCADPHIHVGYETTIYLLDGEVETRYGENLEHSIVNYAGDFIYIPPGLLHQPFNLSATKAARAIVARDNPSETEQVVHCKQVYQSKDRIPSNAC